MTSGRSISLAIVSILLLHCGMAQGFNFNGRSWSEMPIGYYINPTDCPVLPDGETIVDLVALACASWSFPACSAVEFEYLGLTDGTWDRDGKNTIFCQSENWQFGEGAAGSALYIPETDTEPAEVDLALNADEFTWRLGGGSAIQTQVLDPVAVITHELGHWLGMSHSSYPFATMYFASLPHGLAASLSGDDRAGICTLYPSGQQGCLSDDDCPPCETCTDIEGVSVCDEIMDPPGAFCSNDHIYCEDMCWVSFQECSQVCIFTSASYSEGYCAPLCEDSPECPVGFECTYLSQHEVSVCTSEDPPLDSGIDRDTCIADPDGGDDGGPDDGGSDGEPDAYDGSDGADGSPADVDPDGGDEVDGGQTDLDQNGEGGGCNCGLGRNTGLLAFVFIVLLARRFRNEA